MVCNAFQYCPLSLIEDEITNRAVRLTLASPGEFMLASPTFREYMRSPEYASPWDGDHSILPYEVVQAGNPRQHYIRLITGWYTYPDPVRGYRCGYFAAGQELAVPSPYDQFLTGDDNEFPATFF